MSKIEFIINKPQLGANIGMSIRAIGCFGFKNFSIISPRHSWPNKEGLNAAKHFSSIVKKTKVFNSIPEAIKNSDIVIATTVRKRDFNLPEIKINEIQKLQFKKLSILFGQENNGLNNEEISHANFITTIPTSNSQSLNLSHSIAITAYSLSRFKSIKTNKNINKNELKSNEIEAFISFLFQQLDNKNFTTVKSKRIKLEINIRNYLKTANLDKSNLKSIYGITKFLAN